MSRNIPTITLLLVSFVYLRLSELQRTVKGDLDVLMRAHVTLDTLEQNIDPELKKVFGAEVSHHVQRLRRALDGRTIVLTSPDDFPKYYIDTLKAYPGHKFLATSLPYSQFFWGGDAGNDEVVGEVGRFLTGKQHGAMQRIFYLDDWSKDLADPKW